MEKYNTANDKRNCFYCGNEINWEFVLDWTIPGGTQTRNTIAYAFEKTASEIKYEVLTPCLKCHTINKFIHTHNNGR